MSKCPKGFEHLSRCVDCGTTVNSTRPGITCLHCKRRILGLPKSAQWREIHAAWKGPAQFALFGVDK